ncbi:MAG TPA: DUF3667 domain-containing protein [Steroidobacteraceae bacterium]|nr:DUF3667 domain-containing protein [Steroidobacteraceae bacterium]
MTDQPPAIVNPPEIPAAQTLACANCGTPLAGEYCTRCGQRDEPHVLSVSHFAAEALESITHADSRLWRTLWYLVAKPGRLTQEFFAGHRVSYLPPFRLYLVISLLFFLIARLPEGAAIEIDDEPPQDRAAQMRETAKMLEGNLANTPGAAQAAAAIREQAAREEAAAKSPPAQEGDGNAVNKGLKDNNIFTEFCKEFEKADPKASKDYERMRKFCRRSATDHGETLLKDVVHNIPHAMFVFLPLLALFMKALYWRPKRYYVEHLLLLIHNHAFVFFVLAVLYSLQRIPVVGPHLGLLEFATWIYIVWYIFRGMRVYYGQSRKLTFAKYVAVGFAYITTSVTVLVLTAIFSALTI